MVYKDSDPNTTAEGEAVENDAAAAHLGNDFADKMPEGEFNSAEIMSFLVENRNSPHKAVEGVERW